MRETIPSFHLRVTNICLVPVFGLGKRFPANMVSMIGKKFKSQSGLLSRFVVSLHVVAAPRHWLITKLAGGRSRGCHLYRSNPRRHWPAQGARNTTLWDQRHSWERKRPCYPLQYLQWVRLTVREAVFYSPTQAAWRVGATPWDKAEAHVKRVAASVPVPSQQLPGQVSLSHDE